MQREKEIRKTERECMAVDRELEKAIKRRIAASNKMAVVALGNLLGWIPECGFPKNVTPAYIDEITKIKDYREEQGLNDPELRFCTGAYTSELWGKEDAQQFLALLEGIARALGLRNLSEVD